MKRSFAAVFYATFLLASLPALSHDEPGSYGGRLGKVSFATSCDPKVQADFEKAVAMLHSFWTPMTTASLPATTPARGLFDSAMRLGSFLHSGATPRGVRSQTGRDWPCTRGGFGA